MPRGNVIARWAVAIAVAAATLTASPQAAGAESIAASASTAPALAVQGNKLVDTRTNTVFVPHGVNWPSFEYACWQGWGYSRTPGSSEAATIASWKINTVRIPLNQDCWLGLQGTPAGGGRTAAGYRAAVQSWVGQLNSAGIVVVLDLHSSAPSGYAAQGQRAMADAQSLTFWSQVATQFASNAAVMFDVFNEPYSRWNDATGSWAFQLSWACWKQGSCSAPVEDDYTGTLSGATYPVVGMDQLVAAIRATGATQPIMLGGLDYSNDLRGWLAARPADSQLVASWHNYPGQRCSSEQCWNSEIAPVAAVVPVVTGEFGQTDGGSSFLSSFMTWADQNGVGYLPWAWWDVATSESVTNSRYALYAGSSFAPKAPSGTTFKAHLAALDASVSLKTGTLVKSNSSPVIYLVNGPAQLVPLAAFSSATDAGIAPSWVTVSQSAIDARQVSTTPLSNIVRCAGVAYVSAEGKLWSIAPALVAGMAGTQLDPTLCADLPKAPQQISGALFLTSITGPVIYSISPAGAKSAVLTMPTLGLMTAPAVPVFLHVGSYFLDSLPRGPVVLPPGRLVKSSTSPIIYLADGFSRLVPVASFSTIIDAGIDLQFFTVSPSELPPATISPAPLGNVLRCPSETLIAGSGMVWAVAPSLAAGLPLTALDASTCTQLHRSSQLLSRAIFVKGDGPVIYNLTATGTKRAVLAWSTIASMSAPDPAVFLTVGEYLLASIPSGAELIAAGDLIKTADNPTVYLADAVDHLVPVVSFDTIAGLGLPTSFAVVANATVSAMALSPVSLSDLVSCNGTLFLAAGGQVHPVVSSTVAGLTATTLTSELCGRLVVAPAIAGPLFIKTSTAPTIYLLDNGQKQAIGSGETLYSLAAGPVSWLTLSDAFVATVPTGVPLP